MRYLLASLGVAFIMGVWLTIELAWRRVFGRSENPRLRGCSGCNGCSDGCERTNEDGAIPRAHIHGGDAANS